MERIIISLISVLLIQTNILGQTVIIQNQNYQISNPVKVIGPIVESPIFVSNPIYLEPTEPYTLHGFLKVYPSDLGEFSEYPKSLIDNINNSNSYGINTWRLPTEDEIKLLIENATRLGLRQVYTRRDINGIHKDYMYWFKTNDGNFVGAFSYYTTYQRINTPRIIRLVSNITTLPLQSVNSTQKITLYREFKTDRKAEGLFNSIYYTIVLYRDGTWKELEHNKRKGLRTIHDGSYEIKRDGDGYSLYLKQVGTGGIHISSEKILLPGLTGDLIITIGNRRYISYSSITPETSIW